MKKHGVFVVDDHPIVRQGLALLINQEPDLVVCGEAEEGQNDDVLELAQEIAFGHYIYNIEQIAASQRRCPIRARPHVGREPLW